MANSNQRPRPFPRRILVHFETTLAAGFLVILPLFITIWILKFFFDLVDPVIQDILLNYLPIPHPPGTGVAVMLVLLYIAGWFTTHGLGQRMINGVHWLLERVPGVRTIYSPLRSAMQTLTHSDEHPYRGVVLVEFPRPGLQVHRPDYLVPGRDRRRRNGGGLCAHHAGTLVGVFDCRALRRRNRHPD